MKLLNKQRKLVPKNLLSIESASKDLLVPLPQAQLKNIRQSETEFCLFRGNIESHYFRQGYLLVAEDINIVDFYYEIVKDSLE